MFTTTRELLSKNKVVPAFNFSTADVARAIVEACEKLNQDVILQTSMGEAKFLGLEVAVGVASSLGQRSNTSVSLHLDHAKDLEIIEDALEAGYTSVLADGSGLGFEEGAEFVKEVKGINPAPRRVRGKGVNVGDVLVEASLTDFGRAEELVEKTKPDLLAPFSIVDSKDVSETDKILLVSQSVNMPLVLHNSSSKSDEEIKEAIAAGVVKINWNTCLREAWSEGLHQTLASRPDEIKPYNILRESVGAVREVVREKVNLLL